jgi:zinc transport system substrate-binding protein
VHTIFFESLVSPKFAETIANEVGAQTLVLNPLEGLTNDELANGSTYLTVMQENLNHLRTALACQ